MPSAAQAVRELLTQQPKVHMRAAVRVETVDEAQRTVEVVFSTGAAVRRWDWRTGEEFWEELALDATAVRMDFLNAGAPVLNNHKRWGLDDVFGVVERAWLAGKKEARALLRFHDDEDSEKVWRKVKNGILRFVSVGYVRHKMEQVVDEIRDGLKVYRVTDWEPMEISPTPIPADKGAGFRSSEAGENEQDERGAQLAPCIMILREESEMPTKTAAAAEGAPENEPNRQAAAQPAQPAALSDDATRQAATTATQQAVAAERQRVIDIQDAVRAAGLPDDFAQNLVRSGTEIGEARAQIITELGKRTASAPVNTRIPTQIRAGDQDETVETRAGIVRAMLNRYQPGQYRLEGDDNIGREFRGMTLIDIARECVERTGLRTRGMSRREIAGYALNVRGMHSTSDFPLVLENVITKTLRDAYEMAPRTFLALGRQATLPDYKEVSRVQFGEAPSLERVLEGAEYTYGTIGEAAERYRLFKYGRIFAATRELIVNDDLDALTRVPALFGRSAADLESDLFWNIVIANAAMADGQQLFSGAHANVGTPGQEISVASLGRARAAMRKQRALDGKKRLNIMARYLVVPASLETRADQFISRNLMANKAENANVFAGRLEVVAEPRLDDASETQWYLWADPAAIDTIEFAYMEGEEGVQIETQEGFDVDGLKVKARLDFGVKAIDFRGMFRDDGNGTSD